MSTSIKSQFLSVLREVEEGRMGSSEALSKINEVLPDGTVNLSTEENKSIADYVAFQLLQGNIDKQEAGWFQAVCKHWYVSGKSELFALLNE